MLSIIPWYYKLIGFALILAGAMWWSYSKGVDVTQTACDLERAELIRTQEDLQNRITVLQNETNDRVVVEYVDRIVEVRDVEYITRQAAENDVPDTDDVSNGWVHVHDSAAAGVIPDPTRSADGDTSGVRSNQALGTVVGNYGQCHAIRQQLISLQDWVRSTQENIAQANEEIADD